MHAVFLDGQGGLAVVDRPLPDVSAGEARVRVLRAAICATDLELRRGYMSFRGIPGHEFCGVVEDAPEDPDLVGRRVVGEINAGCGACATCAAGLVRHCSSRTVLGILGRDGAFATHLVLPTANLHVVPEALPTDRAVFVEPLAAAFEVTDQVAVGGRRCLVMGAGRLGALCAQVLALAGAEVTVLGRHRRKLAPLRASGVHTVLVDDLAARAEPLPERAFDLVVEATGAPEGFEEALRRWVRPRGTIVLKSTCAGERPLNLAPLVIDEVTVVGSRCGPFEPALRALAQGALTPETTIDARFPLERAEEAFKYAERPGVRKVVFDVGGTLSP